SPEESQRKPTHSSLDWLTVLTVNPNFISTIRDNLDRFLCGFNNLEEIQVLGVDHAALCDRVLEPVHQWAPVLLAHENNRELGDLLRLHECQGLEEFVKGTKA